MRNSIKSRKRDVLVAGDNGVWISDTSSSLGPLYAIKPRIVTRFVTLRSGVKLRTQRLMENSRLLREVIMQSAADNTATLSERRSLPLWRY